MFLHIRTNITESFRRVISSSRNLLKVPIFLKSEWYLLYTYTLCKQPNLCRRRTTYANDGIRSLKKIAPLISRHPYFFHSENVPWCPIICVSVLDRSNFWIMRIEDSSATYIMLKFEHVLHRSPRASVTIGKKRPIIFSVIFETAV